MAIVSISQAAKLVRKGRQTLYNHHNKGKLSFSKTTDGKPGIDTSELERVYGKLYMPADKVDTINETVVQHRPSNLNNIGRPNLDSAGNQCTSDTKLSNTVSLDSSSDSTVSWFIEQVDQTKQALANTQAQLKERDNTLAELRKAIAILPSPESVEQRLAEQADQLAQQHNHVIEAEREQLAQVLADQRKREARQLEKWQQSLAEKKLEIQKVRAAADELKLQEADQAIALKAERDRLAVLESRGFIARLFNLKKSHLA